MTISYYINGLELNATYGVRVQNSYGVFDIPAFKEGIVSEFQDEHGHEVDLSAPVMGVRTIELECYLKASSVSDFISKQALLEAALTSPGLKQLLILPGTETPIVAMVYLSEGLRIEKRLKDGTIFSKFTITLIEPEPVKIVGKIVVTATEARAAELTFSTIPSEIALNIYWGDAIMSRAVIDDIDANTVTHSYGANGTYYVVITGKVAGLGVTCTGQTDFTIYPVNEW